MDNELHRLAATLGPFLAGRMDEIKFLLGDKWNIAIVIDLAGADLTDPAKRYPMILSNCELDRIVQIITTVQQQGAARGVTTRDGMTKPFEEVPPRSAK